MQSGIKSPIWKTDLIVDLYIIKYIVKEKKMPKYITDDLEFFLMKIWMKKIIVKKNLMEYKLAS